jgi:transcriptional regulator with XRE-family HTH domain
MAQNKFWEDFPTDLAKRIASQARQKRLKLNITQVELAERSGVSLGSIKRFESNAEISLKHLLFIAVVLESTDTFRDLFAIQEDRSIDEILKARKSAKRKRASNK